MSVGFCRGSRVEGKNFFLFFLCLVLSFSAGAGPGAGPGAGQKTPEIFVSGSSNKK